MEKTSVLLNKITNDAQDYIKLQLDSVKLEIYQRVTDLISSGINASLLVLFGLFSFLFINVGLGFWLSDLMGSSAFGFLSVGGFYLVVMGVYVLLKNRVAKNRVKNAILLQVSKTHDDYELLLVEQTIVQSKISESETQLKISIEELKNHASSIKEDFNKIKSHFVSEEPEAGEEKVGAPLPRFAMTSIVDFVLNKVVLRKAGFIKRTILPVIANALLTSTVFKENPKTSLFENLKLKLPNFLK